jgi:pyruvate,water dikinase
MTLPAAREHAKFFFVRVMAQVRRKLLEAGRRLVAEGRLTREDDVFFLDYHELIAALEDRAIDPRARVEEQRAAHARNHERTPPRVMTSAGEIPQVSHSGDVPPGALAGSGVSAGIVEGIVRVVTDPVGHVLKKGEILVAPFTDPGWTPLFINAAGVVIEIGGMMTHGSVIAREYGIPAVVSVPGATTILRTGQRIRVNGDEGWALVIDDEEPVTSADDSETENTATPT